VIDRWSGAGGAIMSILDLHIDLLDTGSVGFWPDPDMLEAGRKGRSDQPNIQTPKMTDAEYRAQFSLWSIMNAPLFISLDLRSLDDAVKKILLNKDVIGVNQDPLGSPCRCVRALGEQQMFVKQLSDGYAIVLLNRGATAAKIQTTCAALGIPRNEWNARDLWTGEKTQITNGVIDTGVETHGVVMLRLSSK
jgi:alpha-galactosidase